LKGEVTFAHTARYGQDYRDKLPQPNLQALLGNGYRGPMMSGTRWAWQQNPPKVLATVWIGLFYGGMGAIGLLFVAILLGL
jgi:phycobilisome rod-core linker protein